MNPLAFKVILLDLLMINFVVVASIWSGLLVMKLEMFIVNDVLVFKVFLLYTTADRLVGCYYIGGKVYVLF